MSRLLGSQFQLGVFASRGRIVGAVAGLDEHVRAEGTRAIDVQSTFRVDRQADLVVAGVGGSKRAATLEELSQALATATRLVRPGGKIALLSRAEGAIGPALRKLAAEEDPRIGPSALRGAESAEDYLVVRRFAKALAAADEVYLLSGLAQDVLEDLGIIPIDRAAAVQRLARNASSCLFVGEAESTRRDRRSRKLRRSTDGNGIEHDVRIPPARCVKGSSGSTAPNAFGLPSPDPTARSCCRTSPRKTSWEFRSAKVARRSSPIRKEKRSASSPFSFDEGSILYAPTKDLSNFSTLIFKNTACSTTLASKMCRQRRSKFTAPARAAEFLAAIADSRPATSEYSHVSTSIFDHTLRIVRESPAGLAGFSLIGALEERDRFLDRFRGAIAAFEGIPVESGTVRSPADRGGNAGVRSGRLAGEPAARDQSRC